MKDVFHDTDQPVIHKLLDDHPGVARKYFRQFQHGYLLNFSVHILNRSKLCLSAHILTDLRLEGNEIAERPVPIILVLCRSFCRRALALFYSTTDAWTFEDGKTAKNTMFPAHMPFSRPDRSNMGMMVNTHSTRQPINSALPFSILPNPSQYSRPYSSRYSHFQW